LYWQLATWNAPIFGRKITGWKLLAELGVFDPKRNPHGVVRDHQYCRIDGFKNRVFPELLRHPVNCQLISMAANSSKKGKSSFALGELFARIKNYRCRWKEQDLCLSLVKRYQRGERWKVSVARKEFVQ
jgi:hypothetical protein